MVAKPSVWDCSWLNRTFSFSLHFYSAIFCFLICRRQECRVYISLRAAALGRGEWSRFQVSRIEERPFHLTCKKRSRRCVRPNASGLPLSRGLRAHYWYV